MDNSETTLIGADIPYAPPNTIPVEFFRLSQDGTYYIVGDNGRSIELLYHISGDIVIPSTFNGLPVKEIGTGAFDLSAITSVIIPDSVITIGYSAFANCSLLTSITLPNSVASISDNTFYGCSSLTSITIPNSVTEIGQSAFQGCSSLTSVDIPNSVTEIGSWAFWECASLTSIIIPGSVTTISRDVFYNCSSLTEVTFKGKPTINTTAFNNCTNLNNVYGYSSAGWVEGDKVTVNNQQKLVTIINNQLPDDFFILSSDGTYYIAGYHEACVGTQDMGGDIVIPSTFNGLPVKEIGNHAFQNCPTLTSITIPNSITKIGIHGISDCTALTSIEIPNSVTTIGEGAFHECTSLTSIEIPNSVTGSIGGYTFYGCSSLTSVVISDSVTSIGRYAFNSCQLLTSIIIPASVTIIDKDAFDNCSSLTEVTFKGKPTIDTTAFRYCSKLNTVYGYASAGWKEGDKVTVNNQQKSVTIIDDSITPSPDPDNPTSSTIKINLGSLTNNNPNKLIIGCVINSIKIL